MKNSKTNRGFDISEFTDSYGAKCSIQMSSSAMEDKIWFGVNNADPKIMVSKAKEHGLKPQGENGWMPYPIPEDVLLNTRMHLTKKHVKELLPYLENFAKKGTLNLGKKEKEPNKITILIVLKRLLGFPFFAGLTLIAALGGWFKWMRDFMVHGGEAIAYSKTNTRKTIQDVYQKIAEKYKD